MSIDRRNFLAAGAASSLAPWPLSSCIPNQHAPLSAADLWAKARADFPRVDSQVYLNAAFQHPLGLPMLRAMNRHLDYQVFGPGENRQYFSSDDQAALKQEFGQLINATADEVAFVQSTSDGENIVVSGMDLPARGGNVVIDDLHFTTSLYLYKQLESKGLELRVVPHENGSIPLAAMDRAIDANTRLVSLALVSNINGYLHDVAAIADLAHERGAYVYADIIQAVGAIPVDVVAMGIDFAAASTYKWLMAERGFGLLYVRQDLQDKVVATTRWGHRQVRNFDRETMSWDTVPGAARYETGNISEPLAAATLAGVRYIKSLGVENIAAHANRLIERLHMELPRHGYPSLTPAGMKTPIVAFSVPNTEETIRRLRESNIIVTVAETEQRMRVSVSVFNNDEDVDRLLTALG